MFANNGYPVGELLVALLVIESLQTVRREKELWAVLIVAHSVFPRSIMMGVTLVVRPGNEGPIWNIIKVIFVRIWLPCPFIIDSSRVDRQVVREHAFRISIRSRDIDSQDAKQGHQSGRCQDFNTGTRRRAIPDDRIFLRKRSEVAPAIDHLSLFALLYAV